MALSPDARSAATTCVPFTTGMFTSNAFGADGLPQVALWVAATQKDQAFKTLETFARENAPNMFDGAHNVSIDDIVEAITLTLKSQGR